VAKWITVLRPVMKETFIDAPPGGGSCAPSPSELARWLLSAPLRLEPDWPEPSPPLKVGSGAVHGDLTADDAESFSRLREAWPHIGVGAPTADALAAEAQRWRLPVTPYRTRAEAQPIIARWPALVPPPPASADSPMIPPSVIDLSTHWAGPLATALLERCGAEVTKIDPDCRPDGFRSRPGMYSHLNGTKRVLDLDLRQPEHRRRFEDLLTTGDLLVESFSARVLPNLGYNDQQLRRINPRLRRLSIRAFPQFSEAADWIAYGPGVHAAIGLAEPPPSANASFRFRPSPIAYPDVIAGAAAAAFALEAKGHTTISLWAAVAPLTKAIHQGETSENGANPS